MPQTVTVTGIDDLLVDGDQVFNLRVAVDPVAGDDAFDALAAKTVTTTVRNINFAGFRLTESGGGSLVTEAGATDTVTVVLTIPPVAGSVVIDVTSRDATEVTASPARLTFTAANWNVPQTVTLTGVDDTVADGLRQDERVVRHRGRGQRPAVPLVTEQNIVVSTVDDDPLVALRRQDVAAKNRLIVVTNAVNPAGTMFGLHGLYEQQELDLRDLTDADDYYRVARGTPAAGTAIAGLVTAIAFGGAQDGVANEEVAYVARGSRIAVRTVASGLFTNFGAAQPLPGAVSITDIALDPNDWSIAYALDSDAGLIFMTTDAGQSWVNITSNLPTDRPQSIDGDRGGRAHETGRARQPVPGL